MKLRSADQEHTTSGGIYVSAHAAVLRAGWIAGHDPGSRWCLAAIIVTTQFSERWAGFVSPSTLAPLFIARAQLFVWLARREAEMPLEKFF